MQKLSLQPVDLQEPYIALIDMGMIWRMATPTAEHQSNPHKCNLGCETSNGKFSEESNFHISYINRSPTDGLTKVAKCLWAISETIELLHNTLSSAGPYYMASLHLVISRTWKISPEYLN